MITSEHQLRNATKALRSAEAWFIGSADPARWLDEISQWDVAQHEIRLFPMPRSSANRDLAGVVVVAPDTKSVNKRHRCIPYGRVADRLYVPVEACFDPMLSDSELEGLLAEGYIYVWHPATGLVAFEPKDMLGVSDLISVPSASTRKWDRAMPGSAFPNRLVELSAEVTLTIESILDQARGDIGIDQDGLSKLPPSPQEPKTDILSSTKRTGKRMLASIARWLTQRVPGTEGAEPTWINRVEDWANRQLSQIRAGLDAARQKEIARLLHLLETDPDRGLRFAISMAGDAHRGKVPPSNRLEKRDIDFNMDRLGGGEAADLWNISDDYQYQLTARYRELANRELNLGRHRRAAYIFAELLGDFAAAASALAAGHHWREAAELYRSRLKRPLEAARCLEQGGLWWEAISLYVDVGEHERAGDLYVQLDQKTRADEQYRTAVALHHGRGDMLEAARLLDQKLDAPDEAIEEFAYGWPSSPQAGKCLSGIFELFGRLGRHQSARTWIAGFPEQRLPHRNKLQLVDVLTDTATRYPDATVKRQAADCTLRLVSRELVEVMPESDRQQLLSAVSRLVPEDRLLNRDCQRYIRRTPDLRLQPPARRTPAH